MIRSKFSSEHLSQFGSSPNAVYLAELLENIDDPKLLSDVGRVYSKYNSRLKELTNLVNAEFFLKLADDYYRSFVKDKPWPKEIKVTVYKCLDDKFKRYLRFAQQTNGIKDKELILDDEWIIECRGNIIYLYEILNDVDSLRAESDGVNIQCEGAIPFKAMSVFMNEIQKLRKTRKFSHYQNERLSK